MEMKTRLARYAKTLSAVGVVSALLYLASPASGCGPFLPRAIFTYSMHPDLPLSSYAAGRLGILQPTYARSYLYVAYRDLAAAPQPAFTADERAALVALWRERLNVDWEAPPEQQGQEENEFQKWIEARKEVTQSVPPADVYNDELGVTHRLPSSDYGDYYNCLSDSFRTARETLEKRIAESGALSPQVTAWVEAQDAVFANCGDNARAPGVVLPVAAKPDDAPLVRADRAYQIAAANFYGGDYATARARFLEIAGDRASPWRGLAALAAVRSQIRDASFHGWDAAPLEQAEAQLRAIIADRNLGTLHPGAQRLIGFIEVRLHPTERTHELAARLLEKDRATTLKQDLWDYTVLLDIYSGESRVDTVAQPQERLAALRAQDDLTDWIVTFETPGPESLAHALEKWQAASSLPWLVAAASQIPATDAQVPAVLAAIEKVPADSPAFATLSFHRVRLLVQSGKQDAARAALDTLLARSAPGFPAASRNLLLAFRMQLARNLDELLRFAPRVPATVTSGADDLELPDEDAPAATAPKKQPARFDADGALVLTRELPLALLADSARSEILPRPLRRNVALAAWTKAVLLSQEETARALVPVVAALAPELKAGLDGYAAATTKEERNFAATFFILHTPGLRPYLSAGVGRETPVEKMDIYEDNWWCTLAAASANGVLVSRWEPRMKGPMLIVYPEGKPTSPVFLTEAQKKTAADEWARLAGTGAAPAYLTGEALAWAKAHPDDSRVPESLYLAVRSTRYGCAPNVPEGRNSVTSPLSHEAFEFLHRHYPNSPWTRKTKYWF
jgi:hypothetical protein